MVRESEILLKDVVLHNSGLVIQFRIECLLKYKRQMTGYNLRKPAQRSGAGLRIICYPSSDVYTSINWQN